MAPRRVRFDPRRVEQRRYITSAVHYHIGTGDALNSTEESPHLSAEASEEDDDHLEIIDAGVDSQVLMRYIPGCKSSQHEDSDPGSDAETCGRFSFRIPANVGALKKKHDSEDPVLAEEEDPSEGSEV